MYQDVTCGCGLVDIEETAQMYAVGAQITDVQDDVLCRLKFERKTVLDSIGLAVVLGEAHHRERSLKSGHEIRWGVGVAAGLQIIAGKLQQSAPSLACDQYV